jgi:tRNA threonylcarbamoyl adenosine modification protein YjeE
MDNKKTLFQIELIANSLKDTRRIARVLSSLLQASDLVGFTGDLGAGKTTFIKEIAGFFGVPKYKVGSVSFVIMKEYRVVPPLVHADLYRIDDPRHIPVELFEVIDSNGAIVLIEWIDKSNLQPDFLINIEQEDLKKRIITIRGEKNRLNKIKTDLE